MFDTLPVDKIGVTNTRLSNLEYLGADMIEAGNEFGAGSPYGSALIRVGQTEQGLGEIEREYIKNSHSAFIGPLQTFLEGEMKNITRERKILENRRLDLDACKGKVRKARAMQLQPVVSLKIKHQGNLALNLSLQLRRKVSIRVLCLIRFDSILKDLSTPVFQSSVEIHTHFHHFKKTNNNKIALVSFFKKIGFENVFKNL